MPLIDMGWLREHVAVPEDETYEQLAADLVKVGLEEEAIHLGEVIGPIVVGHVVDLVKEEQKNGKIISWCQVDVGPYNVEDESGKKVPRGIVCGAPNIAKDELVVVTLPGAVLPGDFKIEPRKTYGHLSDGMCASARELGLGDDHSGIILLKNYGLSKEQVEDLKPGDDLMGLLGLGEPVLEINITPDRGYAFSYRGVAREFHHSTGAVFTDPVDTLNERAPKLGHSTVGMGDIEVIVQDDNPIRGQVGCDRYYARRVDGLDNTVKSPRWMAHRLQRSGMRSLSPLVDVTNYVMLDLGQPLHAYDADKIAPPIVVRRAVEGEKLVTLDGKSHDLSVEDLLITDSPDGVQGSRILGITGVMGGQYGEVTEETRNVLLESAHFDPVSIARSARRHKIPSEASRRFERGVDYRLQAAAAEEAAELMSSIAGGKASPTPVDYDWTVHVPSIRFKTSEVKRLTGLDLSVSQITEILTDIGCQWGGGGNGELVVNPPSWRPDLAYPCDLVEEVARLYGYDRIPVRVPQIAVEGAVGLTADQTRRRWVADTLAEYGLTEIWSYPFVGEQDFQDFALEAEQVEPISVQLANPLAGDRPFLRRDLLLTLAHTVQRNIRRGNPNVRLYELGHVFDWDPQAPAIPALPGGQRPTDEQLDALNAGLPEQPEHVAAILTGEAEDAGWLGESRPVDWTDAVEAVRRLSDRLGADLRLDQPAADQVPASWHPGRFAYVTLADGTQVGQVGELHPRVNENLGFPAHSAAFEVDLTAIFQAVKYTPLQAKPISSYPPVHQDLAFTVSFSVTASQVEEAIRQAAGPALESLELFDVYQGDQVGEGEKSLAYSITFRSPDKTLTSDEVDALRSSVVSAVQDDVGAQLRA